MRSAVGHPLPQMKGRVRRYLLGVCERRNKGPAAGTLPLTWVLMLGLISSRSLKGEEKLSGKSPGVGSGRDGETTAVVFMVNQVCLSLCGICLLLLPGHM